MSVRIAVDREARLVRLRVEGALGVDEMLAALTQAGQTVQDEGFHFLSDHRAITSPITPEQMEHVVAFLARPNSGFHGRRCAIVVGTVASYGMMRLLEAHAEPLGIVVRGFESLEEAEAWLAAEPS